MTGCARGHPDLPWVKRHLVETKFPDSAITGDGRLLPREIETIRQKEIVPEIQKTPSVHPSFESDHANLPTGHQLGTKSMNE